MEHMEPEPKGQFAAVSAEEVPSPKAVDAGGFETSVTSSPTVVFALVDVTGAKGCFLADVDVIIVIAGAAATGAAAVFIRSFGELRSILGGILGVPGLACRESG